MVSYLNAQLNNRLGGGEASHLATEALRVSGGEFYPGDLGADFPGDGDKVWGTLVTVISITDSGWTDSNPDNTCQSGDVLQFGGSAVIGETTYPAQFTAVVKSVNGSSRPSTVFVQNKSQVRTVQSSSINVKRLSAGWIRIYRPVTRVDAVGTWKFTVVNNSTTLQNYVIMVDVDTVSTQSASAANTAGSYFVHKISTDSLVPCVVNGDNTIYVETGKANEIYSAADGSLAVRQVDQ